jgi:hypothetical protein
VPHPGRRPSCRCRLRTRPFDAGEQLR